MVLLICDQKNIEKMFDCSFKQIHWFVEFSTEKILNSTRLINKETGEIFFQFKDQRSHFTLWWKKINPWNLHEKAWDRLLQRRRARATDVIGILLIGHCIIHTVVFPFITLQIPSNARGPLTAVGGVSSGRRVETVEENDRKVESRIFNKPPIQPYAHVPSGSYSHRFLDKSDEFVISWMFNHSRSIFNAFFIKIHRRK